MSESRPYRPLIDIGRITAAGLIVVFHTPGAPAKHLFISGLAYFLLLLFCFQVQSSLHGQFSILQRAYRLLVPWLVWSAFYGAVDVLRGETLNWHLNDLLIGTSLHLWFLPFAFLGALACASFLKATSSWSPFTTCCVVSVLGFTAQIVVPQVQGMNAPFGQWLYSLPLLFLGVGIGCAERLRGKPFWISTSVFVVVSLMGGVLTGTPSWPIATVAVIAAMRWRSIDIPPLRWLSGLSMGIYLIHPFCFLIVYKLVPDASWHATATFGFVGSLCGTAFVALVPGASNLAFGVPLRSATYPIQTNLGPDHPQNDLQTITVANPDHSNGP